MSTLYVACIADATASRLLPPRARSRLQAAIRAALPELNRRYRHALAARFAVTLGDELECLLTAAAARSAPRSRAPRPRSTAPASTQRAPRWSAPSGTAWYSPSAASPPASSRSRAITRRCTGAGPPGSGWPRPCCDSAPRPARRRASRSIAARSPIWRAAWPGPWWQPAIRCSGRSWRPREPTVRRAAPRLHPCRYTLARPGGRPAAQLDAALRRGGVGHRCRRRGHLLRAAGEAERRRHVVGPGRAPRHRLPLRVRPGDRRDPQRPRTAHAADAARRGSHRRRDRNRPRPRHRRPRARARLHPRAARRLWRRGVDHRCQVAGPLQGPGRPRVRRILPHRHPRLVSARRPRRARGPHPLEAGLTPPSPSPSPRNHLRTPRVRGVTDTAPAPAPPFRSPVDERELIARVRAGDGAAERELYDAHVDRVYRLAYRLAGDDGLARAIDDLPQGYRTVFVMHDVEGYTHEEIGDALGIETGTSKAQLSRARARLRETLADFAGEWVP